MTDFNINQKVRVKLTDYGHELLREDHESFWKSLGKTTEYRAPKEDEDGWSTWQLWYLMSKLGKYIYMGNHNVIETDIQFEPFNNKE